MITLYISLENFEATLVPDERVIPVNRYHSHAAAETARTIHNLLREVYGENLVKLSRSAWGLGMVNEYQRRINLVRAYKLARGRWQRDVVLGRASLGGAELIGRAARYRDRYQRSGYALLRRLERARIPHEVELGPRGGWFSARLKILPRENAGGKGEDAASAS